MMLCGTAISYYVRSMQSLQERKLMFAAFHITVALRGHAHFTS